MLLDQAFWTWLLITARSLLSLLKKSTGAPGSVLGKQNV